MTENELLQVASKVAEAAGVEILDVYHASGDIDVTVKNDNSPLTLADQKAHRVIIAGLGKATPDIPILSEESEQVDYKERSLWSEYWLVDPLDGTKEFVKRNGEFTVNIALIRDGQPVLGVVHVPVTGVTYLGAEGLGASKRQGSGEAEKIQCDSMSTGQPDLKMVASRSHRGEELDRLLQRLEQKFEKVELVSMGSSLKICLVAEGKADIYPRLALTSEWDTAAAHAVLLAAGGSIVDTGFQELRYNTRQTLLNPYFIALGDSNYPWREQLALD